MTALSDLHILSDIRNRLTVAENAGDPEPICAAMSDALCSWSRVRLCRKARPHVRPSCANCFQVSFRSSIDISRTRALKFACWATLHSIEVHLHSPLRPALVVLPR